MIREKGRLQRNKNKRKMLQSGWEILPAFFFFFGSYIVYLQARSFRAKSLFFFKENILIKKG